MQQLQPGTTLQGGKYKIERVLGQGGFGITYLALNTMLDGKVAIKEFFFKEYCDRDESTSHVTVGTSSNHDIVERFKQKFIKEAKTLFRLNHPNIVRILDIFEENATAYYVMEYIEGESLGDMVKRRGAIPEAEALEYIREVGGALSYIHSEKMNHLDIKPNNLVKRNKDGQVLVIDFGVAKQYDAATSEGTTTTPVGISHGYSPAEQYRKNGVQTFSPQSDVYALAATLYKLLTGITPPEAMEIQDEGLPVDELNAHGVSSAVTNAIVAAMRSRSVRTQSVEAFVAALTATDEEDIEATVLTPANQLAEAKAKEEAERMAREEAERKAREEAERQKKAQQEAERKRAEAMAAKEKAAAQAKAEAERKAREEAEQKRREAERQQQPTGSKKKGLWIALVGVVLAGAVVAAISLGVSSKDSRGIAAEQSTYTPEVKTFTANGVSFQMVEVRGGTFRMGATSEQGSDAYDGEKPVHNVTLSNYYIGKYEVTQELWQTVMGGNPSEFKGAKRPVECVSWYDCQAFISKLNNLTGKNFRLPTEAEWEYAARGGSKSLGYKYSGSNDLNSVAWFGDNSGDTTHDVGTKQPNELGIYDMSGNVWEWCNDWFGSYSSNSQTNPTGPSSGSGRVFRGGSSGGNAWGCRSSVRCSGVPGSSGGGLGLRLALSE